MASKYFMRYALIVPFLFATRVHLQNFNRTGNLRGNNHLACAYLHCENDDSCVHRTFRCKDPPCPSMLYCAKSRIESMRGPPTCDSVYCSNGYLCMVKVRRCLWDQKCDQQIARCVSQREYHEGPASCAGFTCPQGNQCILRESLCASPPCKLLRSCSKNKDVRNWFSKCRSLGCPSEFQCFLRRPESTCLSPPCKHTPDCITTEDEVTNEHCRGWICPRQHKCTAETVTPCASNNCNVKRTCSMIPQNRSFSSRRSLSNESIDVQIIQGNIKVSQNASRVNSNETAKILHTWLDHFNSKTELDAIELWINNSIEQKDFKQFQEWLRSIKDVLGPSAYTDWIKGIFVSTSRSEEFRKWLRTSHIHDPLDTDKLDGEHVKSIFSKRVRPQKEVAHDQAENQYPIYVTLNEPSQEDLDKVIEELNILLRDQNYTNAIEEFLASKQIFLAEYNDLETALLNHVKGEKENYPNNNNMYEKDSRIFSTGNMEIQDIKTSDRITNGRHNVQTQTVITFQNEIPYEQLDNFSSNVSEILKDLSSADHEPPSLWTGFDEDFEKKSDGNSSSINNITETPNNSTFSNIEHHTNNVSTNILDMLIKSLPFPVIETVQGSFDERLVNRSNSEDSNKKYASNASTYTSGDPFTSKKFKEVAGQSSLYSNADFANNSEPRVDDIIRSFNYSEQLSGSNEGISFIRSTDKTNEATDVGHFFDMNKETLLPYIQRLIETMDQENDSSNELGRNGHENEERDPRTSELMYKSKELHSFYNLPSYGVSNSDPVAVENDNDKTAQL